MGIIFQYAVEFPPLANPPQRKAVFDEQLELFFRSVAFDYAMGSLGGIARTYGYVGRKQSDATSEDRKLLRDWLEKQAIKCVVRLGPLEENSSNMVPLNENAEIIFSVDNLTDEERSQATAHAEKVLKLVQRRAKPSGGETQ